MVQLNHSRNGQIAFCEQKEEYIVEFGNQCFYLDRHAFAHFRQYIQTIDFEKFLALNASARNRRKLLLNIGLKNIFMCLSREEFLELRSLLFNQVIAETESVQQIAKMGFIPN